MAQLAVAWVLGNPNVSAAIVGASRPEQLADSVRASGTVIDADLRAAIDEILGEAIVRDPALTASPAERP
jgi:aryl-alcohol dehydrogenase-like predicted oxidoreductase